jgi:hypothetical protein
MPLHIYGTGPLLGNDSAILVDNTNRGGLLRHVQCSIAGHDFPLALGSVVAEAVGELPSFHEGNPRDYAKWSGDCSPQSLGTVLGFEEIGSFIEHDQV